MKYYYNQVQQDITKKVQIYFTFQKKWHKTYITHQDGGSSPHKRTPWIILHIIATEQYNQWGLW